MKHQAIKTDNGQNAHRDLRHKLKEGLIIAAAWGFALALVYLVYIKIKLLIH